MIVDQSVLDWIDYEPYAWKISKEVIEYFHTHCHFCDEEFDCLYNLKKHEEIVHIDRYVP